MVWRHSSATYWCNKLSYFQFCKRFGWTVTSKMPQKYIDREGVDELAVAEKYHEDVRAKLAKENLRLLIPVVWGSTRLHLREYRNCRIKGRMRGCS